MTTNWNVRDMETWRAAVNGIRNGGSGGGGVSVSADGKFIMKDHAAVKGNSNTGVFVDYGSPGTFIMKDNASVSGNTEGGVYVGKVSTFIMEGGTVSGNSGCGVRVDEGTFTNKEGTVSGNTNE